MASPKVLIGCECSQTICSAFRRHGFDAWSCDILPSYGSMPEFHIQDDLLNVLYSGEWDLAILHPPCTYLSLAGATCYYPNGELDKVRYEKMLEARAFFLKCYHAPIPRLCVENPRPLGMAHLPRNSQVIEPWYFGDPYTKRTYLWLHNLPPLFATQLVVPEDSWTAIHSSARVRSRSFPGVAEAMATQWGDWIKEDGGYD